MHVSFPHMHSDMLHVPKFLIHSHGILTCTNITHVKVQPYIHIYIRTSRTLTHTQDTQGQSKFLIYHAFLPPPTHILILKPSFCVVGMHGDDPESGTPDKAGDRGITAG